MHAILYVWWYNRHACAAEAAWEFLHVRNHVHVMSLTRLYMHIFAQAGQVETDETEN